jgi:hypothetical protein
MTHDELENYITSFPEHQRESVYKQIIDSELLDKAFSTSEGKLILDSAVDMIASNVMNIVRECAKTGDADAKVYDAAREINVTYKIMLDWANIIIRGDEHKKKGKEQKK